jgi:glycosyltransferase involved in cell wall biosynthesis
MRMLMRASPLVSLIVPFFNEGEAVDVFSDTLWRVLAGLPKISFEIICVDDGSQDDTLAKLVALAERDSRYRVIELSRNFGKEAALTAGLDDARGEAVILIDADLQDPPELIPVLVSHWQQGADVVLARRTNRASDGLLKRCTARLFYRFHNKVSNLHLPENVGDFRLLNRAAVEALRKLPERQRFMKGLLAWVGFRSVTVDYTRQSRAAGKTKFSGWKLWNLALEGITSFSTVPLKIWTYIGCIGAFVSSFYGAFIVLRTLIYGVDVPGYASLLVSVLFFGSLQLISIGLLGEYIGRIYLETKQRPAYLVRGYYGKRANPNAYIEVVDPKRGARLPVSSSRR